MTFRGPALIALLALSSGCLDGGNAPTSSPPDASTGTTAPRQMYITATDAGTNPDGVYAMRPDFQANVNERLDVVLKGATGNLQSHTLVIDEFDLKLGPVASGQVENETFAFDRAGTYKFYCDVGNHRALGMEGTLTVKD